MTPTRKRGLQNRIKEEETWKGPLWMLIETMLGEENIQFETIQDAELRLGGGEGGPDRERPDTRFCININAKAFVDADNGFTRPVHVQLWITPTQVAQIVKEFFTDMLRHAAPVFGLPSWWAPDLDS